MPRWKVLITDYPWEGLEIERAILGEADAELVVAEATDEASLMAAASDADAILNNWAQVTASVIESAERCQIISRMGIGLDNIDIATATKRKIPVTNVPDYCLIEVAEHTIALLLGMERNIAIYHGATKHGKYNLKAAPTMRRLESQTLGIIGFGQIGRRVAEKAIGLNLQVLATTRTPRGAVPGVEFCDLDRLLSESDYVSLHLPLTPESRHLIGAAEMALMKPTARLINTARGGLIDHDALAEALAADRLGGAALDVQDPEPPNLKSPPWNDRRVIVTPHAAFVSEESLQDLRSRASRQVIDRLQGQIPADVVNPQVLDDSQ